MTDQTLALTPQIDQSKALQMQESSRKLAGVMMSQMVNSMLKTMNFPHEQEMFLSFMGDAVGKQLADSGFTKNLEKSINGQLLKAQESNQSKIDPNKAVQLYQRREILS